MQVKNQQKLGEENVQQPASDFKEKLSLVLTSKINFWQALFVIIVVATFASAITWQISIREKDGVVYGAETGGAEELILFKSSSTRMLEPWTNSIDGDLDGLNGTTLAKVRRGEEPYVIYTFKDDEPKNISRIRLMTDTGLKKREKYWLTEFTLQVSSDGSNYVTVLDKATKEGGSWQLYSFDEIEARYIKLILNQPSHNWVQLGEFEVFEASRPELILTRSDEFKDSFLSGATQGVSVGKFKIKSLYNDALIEKFYVDFESLNGGGTDEIESFYLYENDIQIAQATITSSNAAALLFDMQTNPYSLPVNQERELTLKLDTALIELNATSTQANPLEGFRPLIKTRSIIAKAMSGQPAIMQGKELAFASYALVKSQPRITISSTGDALSANGVYNLINLDMLADSKGPVGIYKMSFKLETITVEASSLMVYEGSTLVAREASGKADGINRTQMGDYELVEIYFNLGGSLGGRLREVGAGVSKTYTLRAAVNGYNPDVTNRISVSVLGDADFAAPTYTLNAAEVDATENNDFIWSDLYYGNTSTTATTTQEWLNGYLIEGLPLATSTPVLI